MKQFDKIKKIPIFLCLWLLPSLSSSLIAQNDPGEILVMDAFGTDSYSFDCPEGWTPVVCAYGSIKTTTTQIGTEVKVSIKSNGYSKARIESYIYADNPDSTDICNPFIYRNNRYFYIYKKFPLPKDMFIDGPSCVSLGAEYTFSVQDILAPSRYDYGSVGADEYIWTLPEGLTLIKQHENGHLIKVKVERIPVEAISCKIGKYNTDSTSTLYKSLLPKSIIPEIIQQPESCLSSDISEITIEVKTPMEGCSYEWKLSNTDWNKYDFETEETIGVKVNVFTSSGEVKLFVYGACDTVSHVFKVSRTIGGGTKIVFDTLLSEGDSTYYSIYPSPNQHIQWTFPEGWHIDIENEYSSTVYVCPIIGQATNSGQIIATTRLSECATSGDTLTVYMKTYPPAPISVDGDDPNLQCFSRNQEYTFKTDIVRHSVMYVWHFPEGWSKSVDTIKKWDTNATEISITAKPLDEASNGQIRLVVFGICGDSKDTVYDIKFTPKDIEDVALLTNCLNKGMDTYTSIFEIVNAENGVNYIWEHPSNWYLDTMTSATKLFVNKVEQTIEESVNTYSLKVVGENVCGLSNEFNKVITHEGAVYYDDGILFDPTLDAISMTMDWEGVGYEDYDTWIIFLSSAPLTEQIQYTWFADEIPLSEDPLNWQLMRAYAEGEAYITCEYKLVNEGCTTRLGKQVIMESINPLVFASKNNLMSQPANPKPLNELQISPNPTRHEMTVRIPNDSWASKFVIYNGKGQRVKSFTTNNSKEFTVDVSDLPQGVYMLRASDASENLSTKIIITK